MFERVFNYFHTRSSNQSLEDSGTSSSTAHENETTAPSQLPAITKGNYTAVYSQDTATKGWQYPALKDPDNQIRLIRVLPHDGENGVRCTVMVFNRESPPEDGYRALSYAWSDCGTRQILVDASVSQVQSNLYDFLHHVSLQQVHAPHQWAGYWWVDALCINQVHRDDNPEKIAQLSQMKEIYAGARETVVWLGIGSPSLHHSMRLIKNSSTQHRAARFRTPNEWDEDEDQNEDVQDVVELELAIRHLLQEPYWARTWILQEIAVSKQNRLVCGQEEIYFLELAVMATLTRAHFRKIDCARIMDYNIKNAVAMDLASVIYQARENWSSRGQDYIYALLGLVSAGVGQDLQPEISTSGCNVISLAIRAILADLQKSDVAAWEHCHALANTAVHSPLDTSFETEQQRSNCLGAHCNPETQCCPQNCSRGATKHCDALTICRKIADEICRHRTVETSYDFTPIVPDTAQSRNLLSWLFNNQPDKASGRYTHAQSAQGRKRSSSYNVSTPQLSHSRQTHYRESSSTTETPPTPYSPPTSSSPLNQPHQTTPPIPLNPPSPSSPPSSPHSLYRNHGPIASARSSHHRRHLPHHQRHPNTSEIHIHRRPNPRGHAPSPDDCIGKPRQRARVEIAFH